MTDNPALSLQRQPEDAAAAVRPKTLGEFLGQEAARENLGFKAALAASAVAHAELAMDADLNDLVRVALKRAA